MVHQTKQGAALDRKKLMADPIMVTTIVLLITLLTLFILYPLAILLVDSFVGDGRFSLSVFQRIFQISSFKRAVLWLAFYPPSLVCCLPMLKFMCGCRASPADFSKLFLCCRLFLRRLFCLSP